MVYASQGLSSFVSSSVTITVVSGRWSVASGQWLVASG